MAKRDHFARLMPEDQLEAISNIIECAADEVISPCKMLYDNDTSFMLVLLLSRSPLPSTVFQI